MNIFYCDRCLPSLMQLFKEMSSNLGEKLGFQCGTVVKAYTGDMFRLPKLPKVEPCTTTLFNTVIKTHGSVSCGPRNLGRATGKCVFYRSKENAVFTHL